MVEIIGPMKCRLAVESIAPRYMAAPVGWAKPPDAARPVACPPLIVRIQNRMAGTALRAFAHPTNLQHMFDVGGEGGIGVDEILDLARRDSEFHGEAEHVD